MTNDTPPLPSVARRHGLIFRERDHLMHFAPEVARMTAINNSGMDVKRFAAVILSLLLFSTSSKAEEGMSIETSWDHIPRCAGRLGKNATMKIRNAPRGTKFISATLTSGEAEYGGDRVPLPENGIIPEGAIPMMSPCTPGTYRWTISAEDASGRILRTIKKDLPFP
jgi:hypothetical protein